MNQILCDFYPRTIIKIVQNHYKDRLSIRPTKTHLITKKNTQQTQLNKVGAHFPRNSNEETAIYDREARLWRESDALFLDTNSGIPKMPPK